MNSVLSAIPIYFMACFKLPQWLLKRMDKIRRSFLWGENDHITNGVSLINWASVCTPKQWGGHGSFKSKIQEYIFDVKMVVAGV